MASGVFGMGLVREVTHVHAKNWEPWKISAALIFALTTISLAMKAPGTLSAAWRTFFSTSVIVLLLLAAFWATLRHAATIKRAAEDSAKAMLVGMVPEMLVCSFLAAGDGKAHVSFLYLQGPLPHSAIEAIGMYLLGMNLTGLVVGCAGAVLGIFVKRLMLRARRAGLGFDAGA